MLDIVKTDQPQQRMQQAKTRSRAKQTSAQIWRVIKGLWPVTKNKVNEVGGLKRVGGQNNAQTRLDPKWVGQTPQERKLESENRLKH